MQCAAFREPCSPHGRVFPPHVLCLSQLFESYPTERAQSRRMTTVASKTQLASWATKVCGMSIGKSLPIEKQCSNGAIYCELLEAARPGSINLQKVNKEADAVRTPTRDSPQVLQLAHDCPVRHVTLAGAQSIAQLQAARGSTFQGRHRAPSRPAQPVQGQSDCAPRPASANLRACSARHARLGQGPEAVRC
jgi:hypothetical protein